MKTSPDFIAGSPTKLAYVDGRPTEITLRRCKVLVPSEHGKLKEHTFDQDVITIGAAADNDLVVADNTVSRNHCKVFREGDSYLIADLGSTNGTFVNRVRIREAWLKSDCSLMLGTLELRFAAVDEKLRIVPSNKSRLGDMIGGNARMREVYAVLEKIAPTDATVIIEGETGTGKEVVARTLHQLSRRQNGPFMVFDCSAVPENLIESELFGHEKGSFTGALSTRHGVFELANGGTVFLDELGELQLDLQPRLLRVLEQREVKRVGGTKPIKVDVRVVAATNRKLEEEVRAKRFREDLFYRLSVVRLLLPALKSRKEDIPLLVEHFLKTGRFNTAFEGGQKVRGVASVALDALMTHEWPGNVRELLNVIERAVSFADSDQIELRDLPEHISYSGPADVTQHTQLPGTRLPGTRLPGTRLPGAPLGANRLAGATPDVDGKFKEAKEVWVSRFEREYIQGLLERNGFNISHAAREADIDRKYFRKLMKKYGITPPPR